MKVTVDFKAAFPQLEAKSDEKTLNTTQNKIRPGENTVVVFIYDKGTDVAFFTPNEKFQGPMDVICQMLIFAKTMWA